VGDLNLYVIAGEPSGDRLGGALMRAFQALAPARFRGVGGREMTAAGLASRFDMAELTVMGIVEVMPKLPQLLRRIRETANDVVAARPDALITIDSPDFTLRVARRARAALPGLKVIHYVAPSVWAWRPGRVWKMARSIDHVLCLLPFEPRYMKAGGMSADSVGHPAAARLPPDPAEAAAFRSALGIAPDQKALLLAPGSRTGEVRRLMPDFLGAVERLRADRPDLAVICPVAETVIPDVRDAVAALRPPMHLMLPEETGEEDKRRAFAAADAALCASGTVALEVAAAGTPMVTAYRVGWLTAQVVRRVIRIDTANLVNLISGEPAVPEFLQERCDPDALADALRPLLGDSEAARAQRAIFDRVMAEMGRGGVSPAERAARSVLSILDDGISRPAPDPEGYRSLLRRGLGRVARRAGLGRVGDVRPDRVQRFSTST